MFFCNTNMVKMVFALSPQNYIVLPLFSIDCFPLSDSQMHLTSVLDSICYVKDFDPFLTVYSLYICY